MSKNLIPKISKLLGVEMEEAFKIRHPDYEVCENGIYAFFEGEGLMKKNEQGEFDSNSSIEFEDLCLGNYEVVKLPWEPKYGKHFYTYIHNEAHNEWLVEWFYWYGAPNQLALKQLGMVFETQEDAEKALPEFYEKLTGKKWEVNGNG